MYVTNQAVSHEGTVIALLGPTNTGKTHRAIDSMLSHDRGMIGFPLRLLARENYERIAKLKGKHKVALITGEEKIIPRQASYYCCTVESMPVDQSFEFIAVDEIQLAEDPDRGHVFTDRILRARGTKTTMFMGSDTMRTILSTLIPRIEFQDCTRFSHLEYTGYKKLTRLPKRSAVVAFSMDDVYTMAEMIRRQRGGTAVVLGALSPRTRNAQVEMYQSGEVDFMVATDAIGMGLNMDIHHVALAGTRKFDGTRLRHLRVSELGQIAGRAGRYMRDGTFGVTDRVRDLDGEVVEAIENHKFPSLGEICWRNSALNFDNYKDLLKSLELGSSLKMLTKGRQAEDVATLKALGMHDDIKTLCRSSANTRLLWEVCQISDFRPGISDTHYDLIADIFRRLSLGQLEEDWVSRQINRLDDIKGDVDTLMTRIAHIRTWTYISFKSHWLERAGYWQEVARCIEDKLSDALHEALIKRFVDQRASVLMKSMEDGKQLLAGVRANGEVIVESHLIGHLDGFRFIPDKDAIGLDYRAVMNAAKKALKDEIQRRKMTLLKSKPEQFKLDENGHILWQQKVGSPLTGLPIAKLQKGESFLKPAIVVEESDLLAGIEREQIVSFLKEWLDTHIGEVLAPLKKLENTDDMPANVRGIAFQVLEAAGIVPRENLEDLIGQLTPEDRAAIRALRIKMGPVLVFLWELNKPAAVRLRALLWGLWNDQNRSSDIPSDGSVSIKVDTKAVHRGFYQSIGYPIYGARAIRIDMLDRVISAVYDSAENGKFKAEHKMAEWLGCPIDDLYAALEAMGHKKIFDPAEQNGSEQSLEQEVQTEITNAEPLQQQENAQNPEVLKSVDESASDADTKSEQDQVAESIEDGGGNAVDGETKDEVKQDEKPVIPAKPELATFRLKKGKANSKAKNFKKNHKQKPQSKNKRGNPKGKDFKKTKMVASAKANPEDNPFAILGQLKGK